MHYFFPRSILVFTVLLSLCTNSGKKEKAQAQNFTQREAGDLLVLSKNDTVSKPVVSAPEYENIVDSEMSAVIQESNPFCDSIFNEELNTKRSIRLISTDERNDFLRGYFDKSNPDCNQGTL